MLSHQPHSKRNGLRLPAAHSASSALTASDGDTHSDKGVTTGDRLPGGKW